MEDFRKEVDWAVQFRICAGVMENCRGREKIREMIIRGVVFAKEPGSAITAPGKFTLAATPKQAKQHQE